MPLQTLHVDVLMLKMLNVIFVNNLLPKKTEDIEDFDFFGVRSIFISPNEQQKQYFHEWRSHE